ncbi:unnamed protein product, partial [marine sediment metagenome]
AKEPWQMTKAEYRASQYESAKASAIDQTPRAHWGDEEWLQRSIEWRLDMLADAHKTYIRKMLAEGKPVPPEVLKDYPDLAKKQSNPEAVPDVEREARIKYFRQQETKWRETAYKIAEEERGEAAFASAMKKADEFGAKASELEALGRPPAVKTEEWKLREAIADTAYGLAHGVKEGDLRKQLTRNPRAKYWFEPEDVDYILKEAKGEVAAVPEVLELEDVGREWDKLTPRQRQPIVERANLPSSFAIRDWVELPLPKKTQSE